MGKYATKEQLTSLVAYMANQINVASGTAGISGGYAPIGTIIAYMGKTAPEDHLICDGTLHQIATYPQLADFFYEQFGASNYFGGNGTTTFAVPDLRGEFLRGAGTNSHAGQGSGGEAGEHQDSSQVYSGNMSGAGVFSTGNNNPTIKIADSLVSQGTIRRNMISGTSNDNSSSYATIRPTNTSILWCIKAVDLKPNKYSTDETMIGHWIDGKPIYQKVINFGALPNNTNKSVNHGISNVDVVVSVSAFTYTDDKSSILPLPFVYPSANINSIGIRANRSTVDIFTGADRTSYKNTYVTLQYTKSTD